MTRDEIIEVLKDGLSKMLTGATITVCVQRRNNARRRLGLQIMYDGSDINVAPILPIDEVVDGIKDYEITIDEGIKIVYDAYNQHKPEMRVDITRELVLDTVMYAPINFEMNEDILDDIPYKKFLDLAITYRMQVSTDSSDVDGTVLVSDRMLKFLDISYDELDMAAKAHLRSERILITNLFDLTGIPNNNLDFDINILRCENGYYGARALLNKKILASFGCDLYIIPSSIFEVIVFPEFNNAVDMKDAIAEVNATLDPEIVLSGNLYFYDHKKNCTVIVED